MTDGVATVPVYGPKLRDEIIGSFAGDIPAVSVPLIYRLGLLVVAVAMVLLPLIYVGIVAGAAYGVYYHAVNHLTIFESVSSWRAALIGYAGPLIVGIVLVLFMIKPLFARAPEQQVPRSLDRRKEPLVFAFVEQICAVVGAPVPKRIDVDCQVNASASFRRGFWSLASQDLVLTLGLPLVAGLNLQQLAGVLAHEFGHFAQGAGMRFTYVIRLVNYWFMRVVYERDNWDEQLEQAGKENDSIIVMLVVNASRGVVWLTRRILWGLMWVGNLLSCFMLRQMEFDADRYEARLVGSETFESTCRELSNLGVSFQKSLSDIGASWQEGRLADSLPGLVRANRQRLDAEILERINQGIDDSTTGLFDTHPADRDRIANARHEGDRPIFRTELGATALFRDFHILSRAVSLDFYGSNIGEVGADSLQPLEQLLAGQDTAEVEQQALGRYFQGTVHWLRILCPEAPPAAEAPDPGNLLQALEAVRERLAAGCAAHLEHMSQYDAADTDLVNAAQGRSILAAGMSFDPEEWSLPGNQLSDVRDLEARAEERQSQLDATMAEQEDLALARLQNALRLLQLPGLAEGRAKLRDELPALYAAARGLHSVRDPITRLRFELAGFGLLASQLSDNAENEGLIQAVKDGAASLHGRLTLRDALADVPYPFHAGAEVSLGAFLVPELPDADDLGALYKACQSAVGRAFGTYYKIMGRLAAAGESLETELGLEPLEAPPEPESEEG